MVYDGMADLKYSELSNMQGWAMLHGAGIKGANTRALLPDRSWRICTSSCTRASIFVEVAYSAKLMRLKMEPDDTCVISRKEGMAAVGLPLVEATEIVNVPSSTISELA